MTAEISQTRIFQQSASVTAHLEKYLIALEQQAGLLQVAPLAGREWYDLLRQKLLPQLGNGAWLVVAVVGGTNIGKSVVFNHLAGYRASASSPLASGTKHPVCLIPEGFTQTHDLQKIFPDFELHEWSGAAEALGESDSNLLFWRTAPELPETLLILDTPDIDSDARVNWIRADAVRRSADVLVAVLTQQKYNDAAVKEFFRKAGSEDKAILVVFNQCLIPDDESYWPVWLNTFCSETGIRPDGVYIAPGDRKAAEELRLPFYERPWPVPAGWDKGKHPEAGVARNLSADLSRLRFHEIRMRTLLGSLNELLHPKRGVPSYLNEIRAASAELATTAERLSAETVVRIRNWPAPANSCIVDEIRSWWQARQDGWARRINSVYNVLGAGILWPVRAARNAIQGEPVPPMQEYRGREWSAILVVIEELFDKLQWMAESGNRLIQPRIEAILKGSSRSDLIARLKISHETVDFERELSEVVDVEMQKFRQNSPEMFRFYRQLHHVSAAVRPVTSVVLFTMGFGPAGEVVAPFVADAAAQAVVHVVADVAGGATAALAGEAAVSGAAGTGAGLLQAWFHSLHAAFMKRRAAWLTELIHSQLLGSLPEDLSAASRLAHNDSFAKVQQAVNQLMQLIRTRANTANPDSMGSP
jgi:hypothetical protein